MNNVDTNELKKINLCCKRILKTLDNYPPHIVMSALTTVMASIIINTESPHSDEQILKTANKTLKMSVEAGRASQIRSMTQH